MVNSEIFKGYYDCLDKALDIVALEKVHVFVFCRRKDVHSVSIVIRNNSEEDRELIDELAGFKIPRHLYQTPNGGRVGLIGLDLVDDIKDKEHVRLYVSQNHNWQPGAIEWLYGVGYYISKTGEVIGKKNYHANTQTSILNIDYFDDSDNLINNDKELLCDPQDYEMWGGPRGLFDTVLKNKLSYSVSRKEEKDQGYLLVSLSG